MGQRHRRIDRNIVPRTPQFQIHGAFAQTLRHHAFHDVFISAGHAAFGAMLKGIDRHADHAALRHFHAVFRLALCGFHRHIGQIGAVHRLRARRLAVGDNRLGKDRRLPFLGGLHRDVHRVARRLVGEINGKDRRCRCITVERVGFAVAGSHHRARVRLSHRQIGVIGFIFLIIGRLHGFADNPIAVLVLKLHIEARVAVSVSVEIQKGQIHSRGGTGFLRRHGEGFPVVLAEFHRPRKRAGQADTVIAHDIVQRSGVHRHGKYAVPLRFPVHELIVEVYPRTILLTAFKAPFLRGGLVNSS